jgi:hypothetical protein
MWTVVQQQRQQGAAEEEEAMMSSSHQQQVDIYKNKTPNLKADFNCRQFKK